MDYSLSQNLTLLRKNKQELLEKIDSMLDEPSGLTIESSWTEIETFLQNLNTYIMDLDGGVEEQMERFLTNTIETAVGINTTTVNAYSFYNKTSLGKVKIDTATTIGTNAFQGCTGLSEVNMSDVQSIGNDAFNGCTNLSVINAPAVISIGSSSFINTKLSDLSGFQTYNLTSIGNNAFQGCTKLTGDILLDGKMTVGNSAFRQCTDIDRIIITNDVSVVNDTILYSSNGSARPSGYKLKYIACEQPSKPSSWGTYWNRVYGNSSSYQWPTYWNASIKDWVFVYNNGMPDTYWTGRVLEEFPNEGTKDGYIFEGWYSDPALTNKVSVPLTLATAVPGIYAKWSLEVTLMIYDLETLEWVNRGVHALSTMTDIPNNRTLGYDIDSWYLDELLTNKLTTIDQITVDSPIIYTSATPRQVYDFEYSGDVQQAILSAGKYFLECWGAEGGSGEGSISGKGGYAKGLLTVNTPTDINIYVGGLGKYFTYGGQTHSTARPLEGGFNGGGDIIQSQAAMATGGGASDIRINSNSLYARVIVAGGGGGANPFWNTNASHGGGITDSKGRSTQVSGWSFGSGRPISGSSGGGATGGGGWYGGNSSGQNNWTADGGDGGSGWVYTEEAYTNWSTNSTEGKSGNWQLVDDYYLVDAQLFTGNQEFQSPDGELEIGHFGNGYVRITKLKS